MKQEYQEIRKFVEEQVRQITDPIKIDRHLMKIIERDGDISKADLSKVLKQVNLKLEGDYQKHFSRQSRKEVVDQILQLRDEQLEESKQVLTEFKKIVLPISLQSNYKVYSISEIMEQIEELPRVETGTEDSGTKEYSWYNNKRTELIDKIKKLDLINKRIKLLNEYKAMLDTKLKLISDDKVLEKLDKVDSLVEKLSNPDIQKKLLDKLQNELNE